MLDCETVHIMVTDDCLNSQADWTNHFPFISTDNWKCDRRSGWSMFFGNLQREMPNQLGLETWNRRSVTSHRRWRIEICLQPRIPLQKLLSWWFYDAGPTMKAPLRMVSACVKHCLACCGVKARKLHWKAHKGIHQQRQLEQRSGRWRLHGGCRSRWAIVDHWATIGGVGSAVRCGRVFLLALHGSDYHCWVSALVKLAVGLS